jgi:dTDP-4-amino-4,6-dideoxygalactose transaminase
VQRVAADDVSTWKDFTIAVDADDFGVDRDSLRAALEAEGVDTRAYFDPPVHRQSSYRGVSEARLPVTDAVSSQVVSLPAYPALTDATVDGILRVIATVHERAIDVRSKRASR